MAHATGCRPHCDAKACNHVAGRGSTPCDRLVIRSFTSIQQPKMHGKDVSRCALGNISHSIRTFLTIRLILLPDLEVYFSRSLGFSLLILALIMLFFTGTIPISSSVAEPVSLEDSDPKAPYAVPIVRITTLFHFIAMAYCYVRWVNAGLSGFVLGSFGYGLMFLVGGWCILFGTSGGRISKRTGRDKRMSGFPFKNVNEYDKHADRKIQ